LYLILAKMSQPVQRTAEYRDSDVNDSHYTTGSEAQSLDAPNITTLKRVLNVNVTGSLTKLSQNGETATSWKPIDGKQVHMFGENSHEDANIDPSCATNALKGATIVSARLLETRNEYPFTLGVTVSCLPRNEIVDTGDKYTYTALPKSSVSSPYTLFEADSRTQDSQNWRKKYSEYNGTNLETQGVLEVKNCPYVFVKDTHPVIDVLRDNRELIGSDIDTHQKIDNEWFKVARQVHHQCCNALRSRVLSKLATHDLNYFNVKLERVGGQDWMDIGDGSVALASMAPTNLTDPTEIHLRQQQHLDDFLTKEYNYNARLELSYELQN